MRVQRVVHATQRADRAQRRWGKNTKLINRVRQLIHDDVDNGTRDWRTRARVQSARVLVATRVRMPVSSAGARVHVAFSGAKSTTNVDDSFNVLNGFRV